MDTVAVAGQFRASKRQEEAELAREEYEENRNRQAELRRLQRIMAKRKRAKNVRRSGAISTGAKVATNRALAFSWLNLISSFGLTLIYINFHVFMHALFPKLFGRLGEEWVPAPVRKNVKTIKEASKGAGWVEAMILFICDLLVLLFIAIFFALFVSLLSFIAKIAEIPVIGDIIKFFL